MNDLRCGECWGCFFMDAFPTFMSAHAVAAACYSWWWLVAWDVGWLAFMWDQERRLLKKLRGFRDDNPAR